MSYRRSEGDREGPQVRLLEGLSESNASRISAYLKGKQIVNSVVVGDRDGFVILVKKKDVRVAQMILEKARLKRLEILDRTWKPGGPLFGLINELDRGIDGSLEYSAAAERRFLLVVAVVIIAIIALAYWLA